jgi:intracellular multiplication protein IcmG
MVEETKKEPEEYKFKEEDYGEVYSPETTKPGETEEPSEREFEKEIPKPKMPFKKRILIVIGIIIFLFIAYQFVVPRPSKKPLTPAPATPTGVADLTTTAGQIAQLNQKFSQNSAKLTMLEQELDKAQSVLTNMQGSVNNLNTAVGELAKVVQQLEQKQRQAEMAAKKKKMPPMVYHVRAIVPGRAWLESKDGKLVTVRPGTKLNSYGKVTVIDVDNGVVKTDLGYVIKYGESDI